MYLFVFLKTSKKRNSICREIGKRLQYSPITGTMKSLEGLNITVTTPPTSNFMPSKFSFKLITSIFIFPLGDLLS